MGELYYKAEAFKIVGCCMEIHRILGKGHSEVIYKDAMEQQFLENKIPFAREVQFEVIYKGKILPHYYFADFVACNSIILEVKAIGELTDGHIGQTLNSLAASKLKLGLLINFGEDSLKHERVVL